MSDMSPKDGKSTLRITVTAAVMVLLSVLTVFYARGDFDLSFIKRPVQEKVIPVTPKTEEEAADTADEDLPDTPQTSEPARTDVPEPEPVTYEEAVAEICDASAYPDKRLTNVPYCGGMHLVRCAFTSQLPGVYSMRETAARKLNTETNAKGSNITTEYFENAPLQAVRLYFGFVLVDDGTRISLCDSYGRVLQGDISGYTPVGYCDLAGHPLFKNGDKYYYYYDGSNINPGTIVLDMLKPEDAAEYAEKPVPTAYELVVSSKYAETTPTLSQGAGMTECTVDENYFNRISVNSTYYNPSGELFRLCELRQTKVVTNQDEIDRTQMLSEERQAQIDAGILPPETPPVAPVEPLYTVTDEENYWWYVNGSGDIAIDAFFIEGFDFSADGLAFIVNDEEDAPDKLSVIDEKGSVVFRASNKTYYSAENGGAKLRDGHYLPDTFGQENTGKLVFSDGFAAVRRKVTDTSNGRVFVSDRTELVNRRGEIFNLPKGYVLCGYSDRRLLLEKNGRYGFMTTEGKWITGMEFDYAEPFSEGLAAVRRNGKAGMIDSEGNTVLPLVFDSVTSCSDGVIAAWENTHGWSIFHKIGDAAKKEAEVNPVLELKKRAIVADLALEAEKALAAEQTTAVQPQVTVQVPEEQNNTIIGDYFRAPDSQN